MFSGKPLDYRDEPLTNNGFWPDLNLKDFQAQRSLPPDIDADTISQALLAAVAEVNAELENVEASWKAKGHTLAAEVPGVKMGGLNSLCAQYMKAVFARAKADLLGEFATIGRRDTHPGQESMETRAGLLAEPNATHIKDRAHGAALAQRYTDKINLSQTKTALHRTRLRFLDHKNFSVLFFYKPERQTAPPLAACRKTQTEKIEKNFSVFHFHGSVEDRIKNVTNRKIRGNNFFCEWEGSFLFSGCFRRRKAEARFSKA